MNTNAIGSNGKWGERLPAGTHVFWLDSGESTILTPYAEHFNNLPPGNSHSGLNNAYQTGRDPSENLAGTVIQSMQEAGASGGRVVVTYQEGLTIGPNPDIVMDQLVGYHYLSQNYGVVRGIHSQNIDKEYFYVLAAWRCSNSSSFKR